MATAATAWPNPVPSTSASANVQTSTSAASAQQPRRSSRSHAEQPDRFYGHRELAELCERVIMALFACPLDSTASSTGSPGAPAARPAPRLSEFIAYALHRTRLPLAVTHQALFLLKRLKSRFPAARGSSGHRLFISALMLASKSSCDDTYSNKSWTIVGQGLFSLREVNQMERELFGYLGFKVNVENEELEAFVAGLEQGRIVHTESAQASSSSPANIAASPVVSSAPAMVPATRMSPQLAQAPETTATAAPTVRAPRPTYTSRASIAGYPSSEHHAAAAAAAASVAAPTAPSAASSTGLARSVSISQDYRPQTVHAHTASFDGRDRVRSYTTPSHSVSLRATGRAIASASSSSSSVSSSSAAAASAFYHHLMPSAASLASRGSISASSDSSSYAASSVMTPSPYISRSDASTPDTPPSELAASPSAWGSIAEAKHAAYYAHQASHDDDVVIADETAGFPGGYPFGVQQQQHHHNQSKAVQYHAVQHPGYQQAWPQ